MILNQIFRNKSILSIFLLLIPLALSAFTHLWNPVGFPVFHVDEGHYMRRAMQVLHGLGPQESKITYDYGYDHPYFGQIFLAAVLSLINYPDSLNPSVNTHSIELLFLVPRIIMGILAVADTFLVYKIAETWYNRKIAFVSSILFAVMPSTWLLRGILLDSIELPFILLSILFAIYYTKKSDTNYVNNNSHNKKIILISLSGIFLGLAIFTKVPVFTMIPLIVFIILKRQNTNNRKSENLKALGIWFIPVVLIPMIWPAYAISTGQLYEWLDGVVYQTVREAERDLRSSILLVFQSDPFLLIFASAGIIYAVIKRDNFLLLWLFPYLIFLYFIGWVVNFHWIMIFPILCIAVSSLIENIVKDIANHKFIHFLPYVLVIFIIIFGTIGSTRFVISSLNHSYIELYQYVTQELNHQKSTNTLDDDGITMIGSHRARALVWIPKYVFNDMVTFWETDIPKDNFTKNLTTEKFLIVADSNLFSRLNNNIQDIRDTTITKLYYNTSEVIATFIDNQSSKFAFMDIGENYGFGRFVEVKANY